MIARTAATGAGALDPRFVALSSSLLRDLPLLTEDILGSVAHALGLRRAGLLTAEDAGALRAGLLQILADVQGGQAVLPDEEDVHMAIEALLGERIGSAAGRLHTGRSRNDQIALDLQLHLREATRRAGELLLLLLGRLCDLAEEHAEVILPGYTHRQRAIPITIGHWLMAGAAALVRDGEHVAFLLGQIDRCPLGAGALAGSSLPLDRAAVAELLGFAGPTANSLDTVGDRDGVSGLAYLSARLHVHMSRIATDLVDFATSEFGFLHLGESIACGSSMMPHKKNPDVFELVRGRSAQTIGDLMTTLTLLRGLPLGYQRDLQEDRAVVLGIGTHLCGTLELLDLGLRNVRFNGAAMAAALATDFTQATDLAEVLVGFGLPFRQAYRIVGNLVARARTMGQGLAGLTEEDLRADLPEELADEVSAVTAALVLRLDPATCVASRSLAGGPAPSSVRKQIEAARAQIGGLALKLSHVPSLEALLQRLRNLPVY